MTTLNIRPLLLSSMLIAMPLVAAEPETQDADQVLRQMSDQLAATDRFTFQATRKIDAALLGDRDLPRKAEIAVSVQRPSKLAARAESKSGVRRFIADGSTLTVVDESSKHYASVPMKTTLDGLVENLAQRYGFTPPLAEFAVSNVYADLKRQADTIRYVGREKTKEGFLGLAGVGCHRIALKGKIADADLWIAVSDNLPRRLVATFHEKGKPQVSIAFSKWNLAAPVTNADFRFGPASDAEKIEMWTTEKMHTNARND